MNKAFTSMKKAVPCPNRCPAPSVIKGKLIWSCKTTQWTHSTRRRRSWSNHRKRKNNNKRLSQSQTSTNKNSHFPALRLILKNRRNQTNKYQDKRILIRSLLKKWKLSNLRSKKLFLRSLICWITPKWSNISRKLWKSSTRKLRII